MSRYVVDWNPETVERLMALWRQGLSKGQIASVMGMTRNAVCGKLHREKLKRGIHEDISRVTHKRRSSPTDQKRSQPMLTLPVSVGFIASYVQPPPIKPDQDQLASIVDVTGCKWPVRDDPEFVGGQAFCNHGTDGATYCRFHKQASVASYSRSLIRQTLRSAIHVAKRAR